MFRKLFSIISPFMIAAAVLMTPANAQSEAVNQDEAHVKAGHIKVEGVVTDVKSGLYTVKTPTGTMTLDEKTATGHGRGTPKIGDELTLWVNESNMVIDAHPKEQVGKVHRFLSGKLAALDNRKSQVTLLTPEGEKSFKIKPQTRTFAEIAIGTPVTVELNEAGEVIDLHKDQG